MHFIKIVLKRFNYIHAQRKNMKDSTYIQLSRYEIWMNLTSAYSIFYMLRFLVLT